MIEGRDQRADSQRDPLDEAQMVRVSNKIRRRALRRLGERRVVFKPFRDPSQLRLVLAPGPARLARLNLTQLGHAPSQLLRGVA